MKTSVTTSILIGILVGTMAFPMIMIPLMAIGVIVAVFYLLIHDFIMPALHHHHHNHDHAS
jgi:hypothetical protein